MLWFCRAYTDRQTDRQTDADERITLATVVGIGYDNSLMQLINHNVATADRDIYNTIHREP